MSKYAGPVKWLGGIAVAMFIFAFLFANIAPGLVAEATRNSVLFHAIPFFGAFVGVLLLFILLIALVAMRFNGKIPQRTYKGVENVIVAGIIFGVVCLFNPWNFVPFRYGFLLLLVSTLSFIVWSHVAPPRAELEATLEPITPMGQALGAIIGLVLVVVLTFGAMSVNQPREPYGIRERVWNSYDDARRAQIANDAITNFNQVELPFLVIFNAFPGTTAFLFVRELVGGRRRKARPQAALAGAAGD